MSLVQKISDDAKIAQKQGSAQRLGVLRFALAQIHNREIELKVKEVGLSDAEALQVLQREAKKRREAIALFEQGGRKDLADKEAAELKILGDYLPPAAGQAEIETVIAELIGQGNRDVNGLMKLAMQKLQGRVDGKLVRELVLKKLQA